MISWTLVNMIALAGLFLSILYTGYIWHKLRKSEYHKNNLADKVATLMHENKSKQEILKQLVTHGYEKEEILNKYEHLKILFN